MKYCLGQLKHLNLSSIDHIEPKDSNLSPRYVPNLPKLDDLGQSSIYSNRSPTKESIVVPVPRLVGTRHRSQKKDSSFQIRQSQDPPKTARPGAGRQMWVPNQDIDVLSSLQVVNTQQSHLKAALQQDSIMTNTTAVPVEGSTFSSIKAAKKNVTIFVPAEGSTTDVSSRERMR